MFNRKRHHHARSGDPPANTTRSTPNSPSLSRCSTVTEGDTLAEVIFRSRNTSPVYSDPVKFAELLTISDCTPMERRSNNSNKNLTDLNAETGSSADQPILERNCGSFSISNSNNGEGSSAFGLFRRKKDARGSSFSYSTRPTSVMNKSSRLHPSLPIGAAGTIKERQLKGRSVSPLLSVADMRLLLGVDGQLTQQNCQSEPPSPPSDASDAVLPNESRHLKSLKF